MVFRRITERASSPTPSHAGKSHTFILWLAALLLCVSGAQAQGIGGYDFLSPNDQTFAFDYNSSGKADHLVAYRPGEGVIYIIQRDNLGHFSTVFASGEGIGSFDLMSSSDRVIAFDYNGSGKNDHLLCYRPGTGVIFIIQNQNGIFSPVYISGSGVGSFDLRSPSDQVFAFDYDHTGSADHIVLYRPGTGTIFIVADNEHNGNFTPVYEGGAGIGSFDLMTTADLLVPFDYSSSGRNDYLIAYRPGAGVVFIIQNISGAFSPVYASSEGIGSYDLRSTADRLQPFDLEGLGKKDSLIAYRPGAGAAYVLQSAAYSFNAVIRSGTGIGGYDLMSTADHITTYDYNSAGLSDYLVLYRPGTGIFWIEGNQNHAGNFVPVYRDNAPTL